MGRSRADETSNLPPGVYIRRRPSGNYYYCQIRSERGKRLEYPLGKDKEKAISKWKTIATEQPLPKRRINLREWISAELFANTKRRAKNKGMEFDISLDYINSMFDESKGKCTLTGIPFNVYRNIGTQYRTRPWVPSIDRIDCKRGYVQGNVRLVVNAANVAMSDFGEDILTEIAKGIIKVKYGKIIR